MSIFITAYKSRTSLELITFLDSNGDAPALNFGDKVRVKIGKQGATPLLDIVSGTPTSGGSYVTAANPASLELVAADLATITAGQYDIEAMVVDHNDSDRTKLAEMGVFSLIATQGGSLG